MEEKNKEIEEKVDVDEKIEEKVDVDKEIEDEMKEEEFDENDKNITHITLGSNRYIVVVPQRRNRLAATR